jgi:lysophospholipid acyltransferase (LPLAT)-like uncharacterized protein
MGRSRRTARMGSAIVGHLLAIVVRLWAATCRVRVHNDPRPALRAQGKPYVYALLHGHQVAAVLANDEPAMAAMVSRSTDGDLLVPSLRARHVVAVRGSGRKGAQMKGGATALRQLITLNRAGTPVLLAVDGPRGPRGEVQGGVVALAQATGAVILPVTAVGRRSHCLSKTWDRTALPLPGTVIDLTFLPAVKIDVGGSADETRRLIAQRFIGGN